MDFPLRPAAAFLSRQNLKHNLDLLQTRLAKPSALHAAQSKMMAVVKANAYGHGSHKIVEFLRAEGVNFFCVASLEEAIELRKRFPSVDILVLGGTFDWKPERIELLKKYQLQLAINEISALRIFSKHPEIPVHIKLDSGMNRLGIKPEDWPQAFHLIKQSKNLKVNGLFSHFAHFKGPGFRRQIKRFEEGVRAWEQSMKLPPMVHLENSAALFSPELSKIKKGILSEKVNAARPGISLYGYMPANFPQKTKLKPVLQLVAKIGMLKKLKKGEGVSYDHLYRAKEAHEIGILPIGYADGVLKRYRPRLKARFLDPKGPSKAKLELCGAICMDMMMLRSRSRQLEVGQSIVLWGDGVVDLIEEKVADPYEINLAVAKRIPRIWMDEIES